MTRVIELARAPARNPSRRSRVTEALWLLCDVLLMRNPLVYGTWPRRLALRIFGARIGPGLVAPWPFRVFMPWNLRLGANCWVGDGAWIHNQGPVSIGSNVVISQGTMITTGSHDTRMDMALKIQEVKIGDGVWLTSKSFVTPGTTIEENAILTPCSVARGVLSAGGIYAGNPCQRVGTRSIEPLLTSAQDPS